MDSDEESNDSCDFEFSESVKDKTLRVSNLEEPIENKFSKRSESSDSRSDAKRYLRKAFVEKLFSYGVECEEESENYMSVRLPNGFRYENLVSEKEEVLYSKIKKASPVANEISPEVPEDLPELITIMFAFDSGSALHKIKKISECTLDKNWVVVFNGVDLQNIEDIKKAALLIPKLFSIIWINASLYTEILPLYEATCEIVRLKRKNKMKLLKKEKVYKKLKKAFMELEKENNELKRRLSNT